MTGRPSIYSQKLADAICDKLLRGVPLATICDEEDMPGYSTVRRWEAENEAFRAQSARAKQDGTHFLADQCLKIADTDGLDPADKRVRIDTRIRLIGKWNQRAYGDKITQEHTGPNGSDPFTGLMEAIASNGRPRPPGGLG